MTKVLYAFTPQYYTNTEAKSLILPLVTSFLPPFIPPTLSPTFPLSLLCYLPSSLPPSNFLMFLNLQTIHMGIGLCSTCFSAQPRSTPFQNEAFILLLLCPQPKRTGSTKVVSPLQWQPASNYGSVKRWEAQYLCPDLRNKSAEIHCNLFMAICPILIPSLLYKCWSSNKVPAY